MKSRVISLIASISVAALQSQPPIIVTSIPKAGTHLLLKAVTLMTKKPNGYLAPITGQQYTDFNETAAQKVMASKQTSIFAHLHYNTIAAQALEKYRFPTLFIYRDPRDLILAAARLVRRDLPKRGMPVPAALGLAKPWPNTYNEYLTKLIENVQEIYNNFLPWLQHPMVYAVRFEDLVGTRGGGSAEKQIETLQGIGRHIGITLSATEAAQLGSQLFGTSATFRKGQVGAWKQEMNTAQRKRFCYLHQTLLEELGYETDDSWVHSLVVEPDRPTSPNRPVAPNRPARPNNYPVRPRPITR